MTKRLKQYKEKNSTCFLGLQGENLFLASLLYLHSCCWGPVSKQTRVLSQYSGWWGGPIESRVPPHYSSIEPGL